MRRTIRRIVLASLAALMLVGAAQAGEPFKMVIL